jgi:hypothetical protein
MIVSTFLPDPSRTSSLLLSYSSLQAPHNFFHSIANAYSREYTPDGCGSRGDVVDAARVCLGGDDLIICSQSRKHSPAPFPSKSDW